MGGLPFEDRCGGGVWGRAFLHAAPSLTVPPKRGRLQREALTDRRPGYYKTHYDASNTWFISYECPLRLIALQSPGRLSDRLLRRQYTIHCEPISDVVERPFSRKERPSRRKYEGHSVESMKGIQ